MARKSMTRASISIQPKAAIFQNAPLPQENLRAFYGSLEIPNAGSSFGGSIGVYLEYIDITHQFLVGFRTPNVM